MKPHLFAQAWGATPCRIGLFYSAGDPTKRAPRYNCKIMVAVRAIPVKQLGTGVMRPPGGDALAEEVEQFAERQFQRIKPS